MAKTPEKTKQKELKYYDVKVECFLPATLVYKVLAESPQQAADLIKNKSPNAVKHRLHGRKDKKITVYDSGSSVMRFVKNLLGM